MWVCKPLQWAALLSEPQQIRSCLYSLVGNSTVTGSFTRTALLAHCSPRAALTSCLSLKTSLTLPAPTPALLLTFANQAAEQPESWSVHAQDSKSSPSFPWFLPICNSFWSEGRKSWAEDLGSAWPQKSTVDGGNRLPMLKETVLLELFIIWALLLHFYKSCKNKDSCGDARIFLGDKRRQCTHLCAEVKWFNPALGPRYWDLQRASESDCWRRDVELNLLEEKRKCPEAIWDLWFYFISLHLAQI